MAFSVWSEMNYTPPRGSCNFKPGLVAPTCSCQRFMSHPQKASESFICDGCSHHASFHDLENKRDDEVLSRWRQTVPPRKRRAVDTPSRLSQLTSSEPPHVLQSTIAAVPASSQTEEAVATVEKQATPALARAEKSQTPNSSQLSTGAGPAIQEAVPESVQPTPKKRRVKAGTTTARKTAATASKESKEPATEAPPLSDPEVHNDEIVMTESVSTPAPAPVETPVKAAGKSRRRKSVVDPASLAAQNSTS